MDSCSGSAKAAWVLVRLNSLRRYSVGVLPFMVEVRSVANPPNPKPAGRFPLDHPRGTKSGSIQGIPDPMRGTPLLDHVSCCSLGAAENSLMTTAACRVETMQRTSPKTLNSFTLLSILIME